MSKDQKTKSKNNVENVYNFKEYILEDLLRHIHAMITFWNLEDK